MKIFRCDNCKKDFGGPLDEEKHLDEHGVYQTFDLCAPCRQELKKVSDTALKGFFKKAGK